MKKTLIILIVVAISSCSHKLYKPTQADAVRGAKNFPGLTVDELNKGKQLFENKCTQCHGTKDPGAWTEAQWRKIVPAMAEKAAQSHKDEISSAEQDAVLKYVITMRTAKK